MTDYNIKIIVDVSQAEAASASVTGGLESVSSQAAGSTKAIDALIAEFQKAAKAAGQFAATANGSFASFNTAASRAAKSMSDMTTQSKLASAAAVQQVNAVAAATGKLNSAMQGTGAAMSGAGGGITQATGLLAQLERQIIRTAEHAMAFAAVMAPIAGLVSIASFDQQLHTLQGISGATANQMEMLRAKAIQLAQSGKFMTQQVAEGMVMLAKSGMNVDQIMKTIQTTMNFAQAHNIDTHEAANILTQGMHSIQLPIDQYTRIADIFTRVAKSSTSSVEQMMTAFKYAAPSFVGFGEDINVLAASIAVLSARGHDASMAGTDLRGVMMRLSAPTEDFKKSLKAANIDISDIKPGINSFLTVLERLKAANLSEGDLMKLFKQRSGTGISLLISNTEAIKEYVNEVKAADGVTQHLTDVQNEGLVNSFLRIFASASAFVAELSRSTGLAYAFYVAINALVVALNLLTAAARVLGPAITAVAVAFAIMNTEAIVAGIGAMAMAFYNAAAAAVAFFAALGPIGWIAAAIGVVTLALTQWNGELYKIQGGAVTVGDVWHATLNFIGGVVGSLSNAFATAWNSIVSGASATANFLLGVFQGAINAIIGLLQGLMNVFTGVVNLAGRVTGLGQMDQIDLGKVQMPDISALASKLPGVAMAQGILSDAEKIATERIKAENDAIAKQHQLSDALAKGLENPRSKIDKIGDSAEKAAGKHKKLKDAYDELFGSAERGAMKIAQLREMLSAGMITDSQFADGIQRAREELWKMDQTPMGGLLKGLNEVAAGATRLGDNISKVVSGAFAHMTDAIVEFAKTGKFDFKKMIDSILEDLLRLALNNMWGQLAQGMLGGAGMVGASPIFSFLGAFAGGFATGGGFTVGGSGGTDSQLVAFKATPGERVSIATPQQQAAASSPAPAAAPVNLRVVNSYDPAASLDALGTAQGVRTLVNIMQRNPAAFRRVLGTAG